MTCRVALLRMQAHGLITLPPSQMPGGRGRPHFPATAATDAQPPVVQPVHELAPLSLRIVTDTATSRLCNEHIQRYHYLGYTPMSGSQLRYNVFAGDRLVALLSLGASAWKLAAREAFIGWAHTERHKYLLLVVNNARFLILPWIDSKGLASKTLALAAKQSPTTGCAATDTAQCCSRPSSKPSATAALATRPPTGPSLDKPPGVAKSPPSITRSSPSRTSGSIHCAKTSPPPSANSWFERVYRMFTGNARDGRTLPRL